MNPRSSFIWLVFAGIPLLGGCLHAQLNGSVSGATITVTELRNPDSAVASVTSYEAADFIEQRGQDAWDRFGARLRLWWLGGFTFDDGQFDENALYLVTARGGAEHDMDRDRHPDADATELTAQWHAIMSGRQLQTSGYKVSALTEAAWRWIAEDLPSLTDSELLARLDAAAADLVSDFDRDGDSDYSDLLTWTRLLEPEDNFKRDLELLNRFTDGIIRGEDDPAMDTLAAVIMAGDHVSGEVVTGMLENSGDRDSYTVDLEGSITIRGEGEQDGPTFFIAVYDADGLLVDTASETLEVSVEPGRYTLDVSLCSEGACFQEGTLYELRFGYDDGASVAFVVGELLDIDLAPDSVDESIAPIADVGIRLSAPELEKQGAVRYRLVGDAGGRFAAREDTGVVLLTQALDYETETRHRITARADLPGENTYAEASFDIAVLDSPTPQLNVHFPFTHANIPGAETAISGKVVHPLPENVTVVATSAVDTLTVQASPDGSVLLDGLRLSPTAKIDDVQLRAFHAGGESATDTLALSRTPNISSIQGIELDAGNHRILLLDQYSASLLSYDLATGELELLSGPTRGAGPPIEVPERLALDSATGDIYLTDSERATVFRIDEDGNRSIVSDEVIGAGTGLFEPTEIVFDPVRQQLFIVDGNRIVSVDPDNGNRSILSSTTVGSGPSLPRPTGMDIDVSRDQLLVSASTDIYSVDPDTGARTLLSNAASEPQETSRGFRGISVGSGGGKAYLVDDFSNAVVEMDIATGQRRSISSSGPGVFDAPANGLFPPATGDGPLLELPTDVVFSEEADLLLVSEEFYGDPVLAVDRESGNRSQVLSGALGAGVPFKDPGSIDIDPGNRVAYLTDHIADLIVAIDLRSGDRKLLFGDSEGRGSVNSATFVAVHAPSSRKLYVAGIELSSISAIDLDTGEIEPISSRAVGQGPMHEAIHDMEIDEGNGLIYLIDAGLDAVMSIELATGTRRIISGQGVGEGPSIERFRGMELDIAHNRLLYSDSDAEGIFAVDLDSGDRRLVPAGLAGSWRYQYIGDFALDSGSDRLLVLDTLRNTLFSVDLSTGQHRVVSGDTSQVLRVEDEDGGFEFITVPIEQGGGPQFVRPRRIDLDAKRQLVLVTDDAYDGVIAVDLASGYRQLIAK